MPVHRRRRATTRWSRNPHLPEGLRRDGAAFFVAPPRRWGNIDSSSLHEIGAVALATIVNVLERQDTSPDNSW